MSTHTCQLCGAAVLDAPCCTGCARRLELALGDVPALVADLEIVLAKLTVYADQQERVTGSRDLDEVVPFNINAGVVRERLHAYLSTWCRLVHREKHAETRRELPTDRPSAMAGWLLAEVEFLRHHEAAVQAIEEISDAVRDVRKVLDAPTNRTTFPLGPCPVGDCDGEVRAYIPRDEATPCHADCSVDPLHTWDSTMFMRLGERMLRMAAA